MVEGEDSFDHRHGNEDGSNGNNYDDLHYNNDGSNGVNVVGEDDNIVDDCCHHGRKTPLN